MLRVFLYLFLSIGDDGRSVLVCFLRFDFVLMGFSFFLLLAPIEFSSTSPISFIDTCFFNKSSVICRSNLAFA